jgi:hypothetical protein
MSAERDRMIETLKEYVIPSLREKGFKGSFPHFRRPTEAAIQLLTFQFDKWGGSFVIEIAACSPRGFTTHWGKFIPPTKIRAWDINKRFRLGAPDENSDGHWFKYNKHGLFSLGDPFEKAALEVLPFLDEAESWWKQATAIDENEKR